MAEDKNIIRIKKAPKEAFNKHRGLATLHRTQLVHLADAVKRQIDDEISIVKTEGEASALIRHLSKILRLVDHRTREH